MHSYIKRSVNYDYMRFWQFFPRIIHLKSRSKNRHVIQCEVGASYKKLVKYH